MGKQVLEHDFLFVLWEFRHVLFLAHPLKHVSPTSFISALLHHDLQGMTARAICIDEFITVGSWQSPIFIFRIKSAKFI